MKKVMVLSSGGIDSSCLIHVMAREGYEVHPVYVRAGLFWERAEMFWLKKFLRAYRVRFRPARIAPLAVLDLPAGDIYGRHWSLTGRNVPGYHSQDEAVYLPGRNVLVLSKAAVYGARIGVREIALAPLRGNPFPDSTRQFFDAMEKALTLGLGGRFKIHTPFLRRKKGELMRFAKGLPLELTFSCLRPTRENQPCGACNKCRERSRVIRRNAKAYRAFRG